MALAEAEKLLKAVSDEAKVLTTKERRHVVGFLMAYEQGITNVEMAERLKVSERTIRLDKQVIRQEKAKALREDDIGLVIADIRLVTERTIRELEIQKKKSKEGSQVRLNYIRAMHEIELKTVEALQALGYYPKNLGNMTVEKFEYRAIVNKKDGSVDVRPVDWGDTLDAEFSDVEPEPKQLAEANDRAVVPAPIPNDGADRGYADTNEASEVGITGTSPQTIRAD